MQRSTQQERRSGAMTSASRFSRRAGWSCVFASLAILGVIAGAGLLRSHAQSPASTSAATTPAPAPVPANAQAPASAQSPAPSQPASAEATGDAPQKQEIAKESAELLKMATALKIEIDKTNQDTLSLSVVRKANEIEQLAHKARLGNGKS
jgi:hypothetical protein